MSSTNDETVDSLLVTLASMGFDLDRGQAAIQAGKLTVHEAVEWLLQGGDRIQEISTRPTPTLSLRSSSSQAQQSSSASSQSQDQNYLPFSMPPTCVPTPSPSVPAVPSVEQTPSGSSESDKVVSRFSLTDKKREDKDRWEREQREQLSAKYKEERMRKKKAHDRVLKEIEDDRKAKQLKTPSQQSPTSPTSSESCSVSPVEVKDTSTASPDTSLQTDGLQGVRSKKEEAKDTPGERPTTASTTPTICTLQIRLPSGQHMRETFSSSALLNEVISKIKEVHSSLGGNVELMQPFPRKVFSAEELTKSLCDLGLTPSGSLVVRTGSPSQAQAPGLPEDLNTGQPSSGRLPGFRSGGRVEPMPPLPPQQMQPPIHRWGRGHTLGDSMEEEEAEVGEMEQVGEQVAMEEEEMEGYRRLGDRNDGEERMAVDEAGLRAMDAEEEEDEEMVGDDRGVVDMWGQAVPPELQFMAGIGGGRRPGGHGYGQHEWGEGRRLNNDGPERFDYGFAQGREEQGEGGEEAAPSPARIAAAALQRLGNVAPPPVSQTSPPTERPIPSLVDMCVKCTSKRLEGPQGGLSRLEAVPPTVAERLLTELKKSGHLRPKTLMMFIPCHLQRLALDCYKYTTNELLQTVRPHVNLSSLNLASCPLITDQGLQHLTSLKKLQHLNLSNNKSLTDRVFQTVQEFSGLTTLLLEGTSVTDAGLETFVSTPPPNLTSMSLNRTSVTDMAVLYLARLSKLKNLGLEQTQVTSLEHIGHLGQLVSVNLSRNRLQRDALLRLHQVPHLKVLHISHVEGLTGDEALHCLQGLTGDEALHSLQGLQLVQLSLPDRHTTTDNGLKCIAGMSLSGIDLTDYIHITDAGIHHLADMTSLHKLSITNTKVTSAGMQFLTGLTDLLELHLDRTLVDDEGAKVIGHLNKLQVLSMAETKITDRFLLSNVINSCPHLSRLNLCRTDITDRGIAVLSLPYLTLLNLDYTCVSVDCAQNLTKCPSLKVIRTNNLRNPRVLDQN